MFTVHDATGQVLSEHDCILAAIDAMRDHVRGAEVRRADGVVMAYVGKVRREYGVGYNRDWRGKKRRRAA